MSTTLTPMTADDLLRMPADGMRRELVNGELRIMAPSGSEHVIVASKADRLVGNFVEANGLGLVFGAEGGFRIRSNPDTVRAPDLAFVRRERIPAAGIPTGYWPGAPDLAVEVISPDDTYAEVEEKVRDWLDAGTEVVWVLNPRTQSLTVYLPGGEARILSATDTLTGEPVLPGFACQVIEFFTVL